MPPNPPPTGAPSTVYRWMVNPIFGGPCPSCQALTLQPSTVRRPRPHALCVCIGDVPSGAHCKFEGRLPLETIVEPFMGSSFVLAPQSSVDWTTNHENTVGVGVAVTDGGTSGSITGSVVSGEEVTWHIFNPENFTQIYIEQWENVTERWIDTVTCDLFGNFSSTHQLPAEEVRQNFLGFDPQPF